MNEMLDILFRNFGVDVHIKYMNGMYRVDCVCEKIVSTGINKDLNIAAKKAFIDFIELQGLSHEEINEIVDLIKEKCDGASF